MTEKKNKSKAKTILEIIIVALAIIIIGAGSYWYYTQNNYISLKGDETIELGLHGTYKEPGATAVFAGKNATDKIDIESTLDSTKPGEYQVAYTCENLKSIRKIIVKNKMNPELIIEGNEKTTVKLGKPYKAPKVRAKDDAGNDISDKVKAGDTDYKKTGSYKVPYSVEDGQGRRTTIYHDVEVVPNTDYEAAGLPILMYHYVYDENDPPADINQRYGNYIEVHALEEELQYLQDNDYYFPTWQEVRDYADGKLLLPDKSIVLCFDDGTMSFLDVGIPALEKCKVPATTFLITADNGKKKVADYQSEYVSFQSHSHMMHRDGSDLGQGGIITALPEEEIIEDLKTSIDICGNNDAFAYPYGDFSEDSRNAVEKAGFSCAVTTQYGKAFPGDDPYLLNRIRMSQGQSLESFIARIK